jgi:DMSO/TMAO reductase YedYZ molybdopterin-dependent catalytic subunit
VDAHSFTLTVDGEVDRPLVLRYDELLALPSTERLLSMSCFGGPHDDALMKGVTVARLLALAGARGSASRAVFHCADGHHETIPLVELLQNEAFLVYAVNGESVDDPGRPLRLAIPGKLGHKWAKSVQRIELIAD